MTGRKRKRSHTHSHTSTERRRATSPFTTISAAAELFSLGVAEAAAAAAAPTATATAAVPATAPLHPWHRPPLSLRRSNATPLSSSAAGAVSCACKWRRRRQRASDDDRLNRCRDPPRRHCYSYSRRCSTFVIARFRTLDGGHGRPSRDCLSIGADSCRTDHRERLMVRDSSKRGK